MLTWALALKRESDENRDRAETAATEVRDASREIERLLTESRHEQGLLTVERAQSLARDGDLFAAKLLAAQAVGFEGFGRDQSNAEFKTRYPVLLKPGSRARVEVQSVIGGLGDFAPIWPPGLTAQFQDAKTVAFSPDGRHLAAGTGDGLTIHDLATGSTVWRQPSGGVHRVAFSPNGEWLASAGVGSVRLWNARNGMENPDFTAIHDTHIWGLAFTPDGTILLAANRAREIELWEVDSGESLGVLSDHATAPNCLDVSPDGDLVAVGLTSGEIYLWNLPDRKLVGRFPGHPAKIHSIRFLADASKLASFGMDHTIRFWRLADILDATPDLARYAPWFPSERSGVRANARGTDAATIPSGPPEPLTDRSILLPLRSSMSEPEMNRALLKRFVRAGNASSALYLWRKMSPENRAEADRQGLERLLHRLHRRALKNEMPDLAAHFAKLAGEVTEK